MIDVPCSQCGLMYHSEWAHLGKCIKCSRCGAAVLIIESAKAVVPSRYPRDVVRRASFLKLDRQSAWRVPILTVAVAFAVVLAVLSLVWYGRENSETVTGDNTRYRDIEVTLQPAIGGNVLASPNIAGRVPQRYRGCVTAEVRATSAWSKGRHRAVRRLRVGLRSSPKRGGKGGSKGGHAARVDCFHHPLLVSDPRTKARVAPCAIMRLPPIGQSI
jgi:hypothetical protein